MTFIGRPQSRKTMGIVIVTVVLLALVIPVLPGIAGEISFLAGEPEVLINPITSPTKETTIEVKGNVSDPSAEPVNLIVIKGENQSPPISLTLDAEGDFSQNVDLTFGDGEYTIQITAENAFGQRQGVAQVVLDTTCEIDAEFFNLVDNYNDWPDWIYGEPGAVEYKAQVFLYPDYDKNGVLDILELTYGELIGEGELDKSMILHEVSSLLNYGTPGNSGYWFIVAIDQLGNQSQIHLPFDDTNTSLLRINSSNVAVSKDEYNLNDEIKGLPGALANEAGYLIRAYRWTDQAQGQPGHGIVEEGELSDAYSLGLSTINGSFPGGSLGKFNAGTYKFIITANKTEQGKPELVESPKQADSFRIATVTFTKKADITKPKASVNAREYSTEISTKAVFGVSWAASDPLVAGYASGVEYKEVQYRVGGSSQWVIWKGTSTINAAQFGGKAGNTYYFRVYARDRAKNYYISPSDITIVPYDNNSLISARSGFGGLSSNSSAYLGTLRYSGRANESITYRFSGNRVSLIAPKGPGLSKAKIYIDGVYRTTIDAYSKTSKNRQVLYAKTGIKNGTHTIKIVNLGTRGRSRFYIDGIAVGR